MSDKKPAQKWYVVWQGHNPGVYASWDAAKKQIHGVPGARYKSFSSRADAEAALLDDPAAHIGKSAPAKRTPKQTSTSLHQPITPSWSVDGACNMETGVMEYRGVDTATGEELFRKGPYDDASNNIGEFLALVHALSLLHRRGLTIPVYSDSRTAISWVTKRHAKTTVARTARNAELFELVARAERWLELHREHAKVLKWDTDHWGENPADFGRK
jgi:ribonuclease HI